MKKIIVWLRNALFEKCLNFYPDNLNLVLLEIVQLLFIDRNHLPHNCRLTARGKVNFNHLVPINFWCSFKQPFKSMSDWLDSGATLTMIEIMIGHWSWQTRFQIWPSNLFRKFVEMTDHWMRLWSTCKKLHVFEMV